MLITVSSGSALGVGKFTGKARIGKRFALLFVKLKKFVESDFRLVG